MKLTPLKVSMLLELYCSADFKLTFQNLHYPAQRAALEEFDNFDLTETAKGKLVLTERGQVFVKKILSTELPKQTWI